jgi:hypothetical protein
MTFRWAVRERNRAVRLACPDALPMIVDGPGST